MPSLILIRGGGDLASGVALRLVHAGLNVCITELPQPLAVRRTAAFAEAIYANQVTIENLTAKVVADPNDMLKILNVLGKGQIPVLIDPDCSAAQNLHPLAIVDARMTKQPPERLVHRAALYLGLGPGFRAPENCHAVIETQRSHMLGRVVWQGSTQADTAQPDGNPLRVLRAPADGIMSARAEIGQHVEVGDPIAEVAGEVIKSPLKGVLRGLIHSGLNVKKNLKIGDVDPRDDPRYCELVSDKALAIGGGVLEALLTRSEVRTKLWA